MAAATSPGFRVEKDLNKLQRKEILSRVVGGIIGLAVFALAWFGLAGRVTWWQGWAFLLFFIIYVCALVWRLMKVNPELVRERNLPADRAENWDQVVMRAYTVVLIALLIVAALDGGRFLWSNIPWMVQIVGWILVVVGSAIIWHVMMTNAYLSSWARIQDEREQVVVQEGFYRYIRHPMYLGIILCFWGIPLILNSWWAMIPGFVIIGLFVYRSYREDQMLIDGLAGYAEYTQKVRYRLLPGIW